ncbi:hypothetical protein IscW_ISCW001375 [Ixodes scapularis]|uniref:Uncharacterized protein n=1 Tax=Ixodes scapularis TaxID=6945 RepID=B7P509_IXOSC|nr:hypothetical protein IscW_ISCW001375 [Ixodes scapularis]|eukprot:XP_002406755.1 hypothetical protein IscW_ISCW001375 [Ixodes scapularis]
MPTQAGLGTPRTGMTTGVPAVNADPHNKTSHRKMKIFAAAELAAVNPLRGNSCISRLEFFPLLCLTRNLLKIHARQVRYCTPPCLERSDGNR